MSHGNVTRVTKILQQPGEHYSLVEVQNLLLG